jgi:ubiquinone biosynthesis protein
MIKLWFAIKSIWFICWEVICHLCGRERLHCVKNIANFLKKNNIIYVKLFQAISIGVINLTDSETEFLSQFTDSVPYSMSDIKDIQTIAKSITSSTGKTLKVDLWPSQSGMISLVYNGVYNGEEVIIKVKRKDISLKVKEGLDNMHMVIRMSRWVPWLWSLDLNGVYRENIEDLLKQCDFKNEVENASRFWKNFSKVKYAKVPKVYPEVTVVDNDVIVMEKLKGWKIKEVPNERRREYGGLLAKTVMKSVLYDGFFHADMHSGNMLFINDVTPCIGIFDFGIMGSLTDTAMEGFYEFFKAGSIYNDSLSAAKAITRLLVAEPNDYDKLDLNIKENITNELESLVSEIFSTNSHLDISIVKRCNKLLSSYGLILSKEFCKIQLAMAVSSGVATELCGGTAPYMEEVTRSVKSMIGSEISMGLF